MSDCLIVDLTLQGNKGITGEEDFMRAIVWPATAYEYSQDDRYLQEKV